MTAEPVPSADLPGRAALEIERKYDVDDATPVPQWTRITGIVRVGDAEPRDLDARYLDTDDRALAIAGVAVRCRTGGPDAGWHVKTKTAAGRVERHWPLGSDDESVPDDVAAAVAAITRGALVPLARIRNARTAHALYDERDRIVAEFVDDRVTATDVRAGVTTSWREWEVELGPAGPSDPAGIRRFFEAADRLVVAAGGRVAASDSKLARAIGS